MDIITTTIIVLLYKLFSGSSGEVHIDENRTRLVSHGCAIEQEEVKPYITYIKTQNLKIYKVGFFEVVTPLGGVRVFSCASESCFGSHAFVSRPIWSNQSFTDSQNYALSGDIRFSARRTRRFTQFAMWLGGIAV
eukprot:sb/3474684/